MLLISKVSNLSEQIINTKEKKSSERFWQRSRQVHLTMTKVRMSTMAPAHPLVRENGSVQFEQLFLY